MRNTFDRIRHTLGFEITGMIMSVPLFAHLMDRSLDKTGVLAVGMSLTAMIWNYGYNLAFDHLMVRMGRRVDDRPPKLRMMHALGFETSFLCVTVPAVAWWLEMSFLQALIMDIGMAGFYTVHAYIYNWAYDRVFPMPVTEHD